MLWLLFFFFNDAATTEIYTLSLHDALPISPAFNVVVSNVPGFTEQRYLEGSSLDEYYPLSLLFHGQGLNITAISNAGWFCVGYTGARDAVPHLQRIAVASGQEIGRASCRERV